MTIMIPTFSWYGKTQLRKLKTKSTIGNVIQNDLNPNGAPKGAPTGFSQYLGSVRFCSVRVRFGSVRVRFGSVRVRVRFGSVRVRFGFKQLIHNQLLINN